MIVLKNYYWIDAVHWNAIPFSVRNNPTEKLLVIKSSLSVLLFPELFSATTYQLFIHYVLTLSSLVQVFLKKGVLGISRLVVSLFRRCITFCKECKLYSR